MIVDNINDNLNNKIRTDNVSISSKIWFGNPQIELIEGNLSFMCINYYFENGKLSNNSINFVNSEYDENELEAIKQYIWEINIKNTLINSSELCCINVPNKISIKEFLSSISIYLSYISLIKVLKSSIPNSYHIYLQMKNKEYSNIFYNTFNYSKINPIEKEYFIFAQVEEINFEEKTYEEKELKICPICLESINSSGIENINSSNYLTSLNGNVYILCGHAIHIECFLKLNDDKCPLCRYYISPANISTCSLCTCENDLWMCLVCGSINCGEEGGSNNHRKEHYISTGHMYTKCLGDSHNNIYDFSKNSAINIWLQNEILSNNSNNIQSNDNEDLMTLAKDPKEKVEYIMAEYNSIISSQLESQRFYYLNLIRKIEQTYEEENAKLEEEFYKYENLLKDLNSDCITWEKKKDELLNLVIERENKIKILENNYKLVEDEYTKLTNLKKKNETNNQNKNDIIIKQIENVDLEIQELTGQIKELKIHLNALDNISGELSGAKIEFISNNNDTKKKGGKKKK